MGLEILACGFEDSISHLTRELKRIALPIPRQELINVALAFRLRNGTLSAPKKYRPTT